MTNVVPLFKNGFKSGFDKDSVEFAAQWAWWVHQEKDQKYGDHPYSYHLCHVVQILQDAGLTQDHVLKAGWLHDTVEDTDATIEEIVRIFGIEVGMIVWACTGVGRNRFERQASIKSKLIRIPEACNVKCADNTANIEESIRTNNAEKFSMYYGERMANKRLYELHTNYDLFCRWEGNFIKGVEKGLLIE